nr:hypothetical protein [Tanacetum cinerariifolium]
MVAILEKYEQNTDFHQIVDFVGASHIRYTLTFNPTIYVSHIRQFWSTVRIETTDEGTKILATMDGILITVIESSIRHNLKLNDEEGLNSLPDTELFENLTLMGYNISPNQKFTFQKGQFSHQWNFLIHTIMQCLSSKSTWFNEFSSNVATALVCLATNRTYNFSKMIFDGLVKNVNNKVSKFLMYPRFLTMFLRMGQFGQITHTHTYVVPFHTQKLFTTLRVNSPSFSGRTVPFFDTILIQQGEGSGTPTEPHHTPSPKAQPSSHTHISSPTLPTVTTIPTVTPSETTPLRQYTRRARITQSSDLSLVADEPASPMRDVSQARVKFLEDRQGEGINLSGYDAPINGRRLDEEEVATERVSSDTEEIRLDEGGVAADRVSDDTEEMAIAPANVSISTGSGVVPTASTTISTATPIFATATTVTPYTRRKGKKRWWRLIHPRRRRDYKSRLTSSLPENWEELERKAQRMNAQISRDEEIAKIHAKEEFIKLNKERLGNNLGWKVKDFKGMYFEEVEAKFKIVWEQIEGGVSKISEGEATWLKRKGIRSEQESAKKQKTSEEVPKEVKSSDEDEGSGTPTEPHHRPSQEAQPSSHTHIYSPTLPTVTTIPTVTPSETTPLRQYTRRARIAHLQLRFQELMDFCTSLQRQQSELVSKFTAQALEIIELKARVKFLEDRQGEGINLSGDDAPIKGRRLDKEEVASERVSRDTEEIRLDEGEVAAERVSNDTEEMATVLIIMGAVSVLSNGGVQVVATDVAVASANVITPYTRRRGKEKMVETHTPKKKKRLQEQIDIQFASELEEESNETIAKHLEECKQAAAKLTIEERIVLISELVKYQDHHSKILQYQAQQRKTRTKKQKRDFYIAVIRNNLEEVPEEVKSSDEFPGEKIKELIRLVPIEEVYIEALQVKHPIIDWKVHIEGQKSYWKITRLGGSSASYQFFVDMLKQIDREDLNQLWALVKETLSVWPAIDEKEMELWVELKRLY